MNQFVKNVERIEFAVTFACTGKCRHCSEGDHLGHSGHIDTDAAVRAVRDICANFDIRSLMTFGGEPLLYPETTCAIHKVASELGIPKRQLITNGYFSKDEKTIARIAQEIAEAGVNDLLLSVDAFHQETIPLGTVRLFAECLLKEGVPVCLSPAWLVSREDTNPYNEETRKIIEELKDLQIPLGDGNVIFPSGNALKYLSDYLDPDMVSPYEDDPEDLRAISFGPTGDVDILGGNICETPIMDIVEAYRP